MNIILLRPEEIRSRVFSFVKTDERFRHIQKILKLTKGSVFKAGIIDGEKGTAEITAFSDEQLTASFTAAEQPAPLPPIRLILGFPRPIQLRRIVRDIAGLGIESLYLTGTELGEKSYLQAEIAAETEVERLLIDGCSQAGETRLPHVYHSHSLRRFFDRHEAEIRPEQVRCVLDVPASAETGDSNDRQTAPPIVARPIRPLSQLRWNGREPLWLAVGNERGWSDAERLLFAEKQFSAYSMGRRILRTETAVTSALAVCLAASGIWEK